MNSKTITLGLIVPILLTALMAGCGAGSNSGSSSSSSSTTGFSGGNGLTPVINSAGGILGDDGGINANLCEPGHQQLLNLNISDIYMLDSNNVRLPWTAAELSSQQTGTITVGSQTHNISWLKVSLNQLFFPTSPLGSEFTRISYDITKSDAKYNVWSQSLPTGFIQIALLENVLLNPSGFLPIVSLDESRGLHFSSNPTNYANFLENFSDPIHAVNDLRPGFNWISSQTTRKIVVVQMCGADLEDSTAAIDPALGYRPLIRASSNPILIELNEEVAPALQ